MADKSPLPTSRFLEQSGDEPAPGQHQYSDISGLKRLSSVSSGGGDGAAGDSSASRGDQRRTSWSESEPDSARQAHSRSQSCSRPQSGPGRGPERRRRKLTRTDGTEDSGREWSTSPVKQSPRGRTEPQPERDDSWGAVSPIPFAAAGGEPETGAGDGPPSGRRVATAGDVSEGGDSWGDDSPVPTRPRSQHPPASDADPEPRTETKQETKPEPEVERADSVSEDSWGDSGGSPILPGSPSGPAPTRRTSAVSRTDDRAGLTRDGRTASEDRGTESPPARRRSGADVPRIQHPAEDGEDGEEEDQEDLSSWGDVSPVLPRSPAVPRRESLAGGTGDRRAADSSPPPATETESPRPDVRTTRPPSPDQARLAVAPDPDSWGDVSPVLPRSPPGPVAPPQRRQSGPADPAAAETSWTHDTGGPSQRPTESDAAGRAGAEDSWGDVSPILSRQTVTAGAAVRQTTAEDSWGGDSLPSEPAAVTGGAVGDRTGTGGAVTDRRAEETGGRPQTPDQPSEDDSWGDDSLPGMGHSDSGAAPSKHQMVQSTRKEVNATLVHTKSKDGSVSGNVTTIAKVDEESWGDHSSSVEDKGTCKSGENFKRRRSSDLRDKSVREMSESAAGSGHDSFVSAGHKRTPEGSVTHLVEENAEPGVMDLEEVSTPGTAYTHSKSPATHGGTDGPLPSQRAIFPPRRLPGIATDSVSPSSAVPARADLERPPAPRARLSSWCDDPVPVAGPPAAVGGAEGGDDSGSWDDSSSACDAGGDSARLVTSPPREQKRRNSPSALEQRDQPVMPPGPESAHEPESAKPAAVSPPDPDADSWDSSASEPAAAADRRSEPAPTGEGAVTSPERPARRRSVTLLSPPRSRETSASEPADASHTQVSGAALLQCSLLPV